MTWRNIWEVALALVNICTVGQEEGSRSNLGKSSTVNSFYGIFITFNVGHRGNLAIDVRGGNQHVSLKNDTHMVLGYA